MRRPFAVLFGVALSTGLSSELLVASDYYSVPVDLSTTSHEKLGGGQIDIDWNTAASVPTVFYIFSDLSDYPNNSPVVAPPLATADEASAWALEFIDAHPEFFAVPSTAFELVGAGLGGLGWGINFIQTYQGIWVKGAEIAIHVIPENGVLAHIDARLFPAADLEGLDPVPAVSAEAAAAAAVAAHGEGARAFTPELRVAFRGITPFLAWQMEVGDVTLPPEQRIPWLYLVAGDTGEVLSVACLCASLESRLFVRGDVNDDGRLDISDPVAVLFDLFVTPSKLVCKDAMDANDDGRVDISDAVHSLNFLFLGGAPQPRPYPLPGPDLTLDRLHCPVGS